MTRSELESLEEGKMAYIYLVTRLKQYRLTLDTVILENSYTQNGNLSTSFTFISHNRSGKQHTDNFRLYNDQYLWFLCSLQQDFPEMNVVDNRQYRPTERSDNDIQAITQTEL